MILGLCAKKTPRGDWHGVGQTEDVGSGSEVSFKASILSEIPEWPVQHPGRIRLIGAKSHRIYQNLRDPSNII